MLHAARRFIANTPAFLLACILFAAIAAGCAYLVWPDMVDWARIALHRPDTRAQLWQRWATHYAGLFGMLPYPARIGVQYTGERAAGVLILKSASGFNAETRPFLIKANPGVIFILDAAARAHLLAGWQTRAPEDIWQMMKDDLYADHIKIWYDPDIEALNRGGYLRLMRAIDTRPEQLSWRDVKKMLGEPPN